MTSVASSRSPGGGPATTAREQLLPGLSTRAAVVAGALMVLGLAFAITLPTLVVDLALPQGAVLAIGFACLLVVPGPYAFLAMMLEDGTDHPPAPPDTVRAPATGHRGERTGDGRVLVSGARIATTTDGGRLAVGGSPLLVLVEQPADGADGAVVLVEAGRSHHRPLATAVAHVGPAHVDWTLSGATRVARLRVARVPRWPRRGRRGWTLLDDRGDGWEFELDGPTVRGTVPPDLPAVEAAFWFAMLRRLDHLDRVASAVVRGEAVPAGRVAALPGGGPTPATVSAFRRSRGHRLQAALAALAVGATTVVVLLAGRPDDPIRAVEQAAVALALVAAFFLGGAVLSGLAYLRVIADPYRRPALEPDDDTPREVGPAVGHGAGPAAPPSPLHRGEETDRAAAVAPPDVRDGAPAQPRPRHRAHRPLGRVLVAVGALVLVPAPYYLFGAFDGTAGATAPRLLTTLFAVAMLFVAMAALQRDDGADHGRPETPARPDDVVRPARGAAARWEGGVVSRDGTKLAELATAAASAASVGGRAPRLVRVEPPRGADVALALLDARGPVRGPVATAVAHVGPAHVDWTWRVDHHTARVRVARTSWWARARGWTVLTADGRGWRADVGPSVVTADVPRDLTDLGVVFWVWMLVHLGRLDDVATSTDPGPRAGRLHPEPGGDPVGRAERFARRRRHERWVERRGLLCLLLAFGVVGGGTALAATEVVAVTYPLVVAGLVLVFGLFMLADAPTAPWGRPDGRWDADDDGLPAAPGCRSLRVRPGTVGAVVDDDWGREVARAEPGGRVLIVGDGRDLVLERSPADGGGAVTVLSGAGGHRLVEIVEPGDRDATPWTVTDASGRVHLRPTGDPAPDRIDLVDGSGRRWSVTRGAEGDVGVTVARDASIPLAVAWALHACEYFPWL